MCTEQRGLSLIELIVFIVIISVGLAGVLSSLNLSAMHSADPLQPKQALALAESALEAMLLKDYADIVTPSPATRTVLAGYPQTISVSDTTLSGLAAKKILVTVDTPGSGSIALTGYRTNY